MFFSFIGGAKAEPNIKFHNDIRINAHTFLIEVALGSKELPKEIKDKKETIEAVNAYSAIVSSPRFHLLFSNNEVAELTSILINSNSLKGSHCPSLCSTLLKFIPIFEASSWNLIHSENEQWIQNSNELLKKYGSKIESQLTEYFGTQLIPKLHNIYVVENINKGATTSGRKPLTIMSSTNSEYQNFNALEMIYHEVAHTYATSRDGAFRGAIKEVFGGELVPRDFWHVIHFYTVGFTVKKVLSEEGLNYKTYAYSYGLYTGRWSESAELIEKYWISYLEGRKTMKEALYDMKNYLASNK